MAGRPPSDERIEQFMGNLLRGGVVLAALVVCLGGAVYLTRHAAQPVELRDFHGEPEDLRSLIGTIQRALQFSGRGIIQLGLLLLIATPVARVVFSAFAFAWQRDYTYVAITLVVLGVLIYSLFFDTVSAEG